MKIHLILSSHWYNYPLGYRVVSVIAEEKMCVAHVTAPYCTCGRQRCVHTRRRGDQGYALPLCGLPPRHPVFSLAPGWPVDPIATQSVPSAPLSADALRPGDSEGRTP